MIIAVGSIVIPLQWVSEPCRAVDGVHGYNPIIPEAHIKLKLITIDMKANQTNRNKTFTLIICPPH